ncbi:MAG: hypothetical protein ACI9MR_004924 [Myxococcota bacterium]
MRRGSLTGPSTPHRGDSQTVLFFGRCAVFVCVAALCACGSTAFDHGGPASRPGVGTPGLATIASVALAPPDLEVTPERAISGWFAPATVVSHSADPNGREGAMRLAVRTSEGDDVVVRYRLGPIRQVPVREGESVLIRYYPSATPDSATDALVVATQSGGALAIITRRNGLPPGVLPQQAVVTVSREPARLVYTEVRELPSLCVVRVDHQTLRLEVDGAVNHVIPGSIAPVDIGGVPFELIAYDASLELGPPCPDVTPAHLSYALIRTRP